MGMKKSLPFSVRNSPNRSSWQLKVRMAYQEDFCSVASIRIKESGRREQAIFGERIPFPKPTDNRDMNLSRKIQPAVISTVQEPKLTRKTDMTCYNAAKVRQKKDICKKRNIFIPSFRIVPPPLLRSFYPVPRSRNSC